MTRWIIAAALLLAFLPNAQALPQESRVPGGIAYITVPGGANAPGVEYGGHRTAVIKRGNEWVAVVGIPLAA